MISRNLKNYFIILQAISKIKNVSQRKKLLEGLKDNNEVFRAIQEIVLNSVRGNIPFNNAEKAKLRRYKKILKQILKPRISKKSRKKLVSQCGGFLPLLLPAAASTLAAIIPQLL